jgi:hypothetical protein
LKDKEKWEGLLEKGDSLSERITSWEENLIQVKQKTFQDVINYNNKLNSELLFLKSFNEGTMPKVSQGSKQRLTDLKRDWNTYEQERNTIINTEMAAFNAMFKELNIPAIILDKE